MLFPESKMMRQHCAFLLGGRWIELQSAFHSERNILISLCHIWHDSWKLHSGGRLLHFHEANHSASRTHISYQLIQGAGFFLPTTSWHYKCHRLICYVMGEWNEQGPCGFIRIFNRRIDITHRQENEVILLFPDRLNQITSGVFF